MSQWTNKLVWLLALAPLAGCWVGSDQVAIKVRDLDVDSDSDSDSDSEVIWDDLVLGTVEPSVGTNAGGAEVRLVVGPLDPEVPPEVAFAGVQAVILEHDADSVLVTAPAVGVEGAVEVSVTSAGRVARASEAFYYWADGAGRVGLVGRIDNYDFDRGYDIDWMFVDVPAGNAAEMHSARIRYVEPVDVEPWREWSDSFDSCTRNYVYDGPSLNVLKAGVDEIRVGSGGGAYSLEVDDNREAFVLPMSRGWIPASRGLQLAQDAGDAGWFAFEVDDAVSMPSTSFRVTSPAADQVMGSVGRGFDLRWEGGAPGAVVLARFNRYEYDWIDEVWSLRDIVTCALRDDGGQRISADLFSELGQDNLVTIRVGRALVEDARLPTNRAGVGIYGMHWWYGAAYMD